MHVHITNLKKNNNYPNLCYLYAHEVFSNQKSTNFMLKFCLFVVVHLYPNVWTIKPSHQQLSPFTPKSMLVPCTSSIYLVQTLTATCVSHTHNALVQERNTLLVNTRCYWQFRRLKNLERRWRLNRFKQWYNLVFELMNFITVYIIYIYQPRKDSFLKEYNITNIK